MPASRGFIPPSPSVPLLEELVLPLLLEELLTLPLELLLLACIPASLSSVTPPGEPFWHPPHALRLTVHETTNPNASLRVMPGLHAVKRLWCPRA